jgi:integrase
VTKTAARPGANAPWTETAIQAYFAENPDQSRKGRPDPIHWLPKIALLTGMRISEICALERHDVKEAERVAYFDIPAGKTDSAVRVVPIHPDLRPFLDLAPARGYLFPELRPGGKDGKRSWAVGKRLGRRIYPLEGASTFHGLRKNVVQTFERAHVPEGEAAQIVGHGKKGITYGVYSPNGLRIDQKRDLIGLLSIPT